MIADGYVVNINVELRVQSAKTVVSFRNSIRANILQTFHLTFSLRMSIGGPISNATTFPFGKISARLRVVSPDVVIEFNL